MPRENKTNATQQWHQAQVMKRFHRNTEFVHFQHACSKLQTRKPQTSPQILFWNVTGTINLIFCSKTARYLLSAGRMSTNGWTSEFDMGIRLIVIYNEIHCGIHKPLFRSEVPEWLNGKWIIWNIQFIFVINIIHLSVTLPKILFSF